MNGSDSKARIIDIINPSAGKKRPLQAVSENHQQYITKFAGDAESRVKEFCIENPNTIFNIYGGDGTIYEVINGIMSAGANGTSKISVVPTGTGNDFYRIIPKDRSEMKIDLIKYHLHSAVDSTEKIRYSVNMINIGFDCDVVKKTDDIKKLPFIKGSLAYIFGVINVFFHKFGKHFKIDIQYPNGNRETVEDELLLTAIANGGYCGGGFFAAPTAKLDDGLLDLLIVRKISRLKFISLVGDYRNGTHIDAQTSEPIQSFKEVLKYLKCSKITVSGIERVCIDGQIFNADAIEIAAESAALDLVIEQ